MDIKKTIDDLPNEVFHYIFAYLPHLEQRKVLALVCCRWNNLAFDHSYLGRIQFNLTGYEESSISPQKFTRLYRNIHLNSSDTPTNELHKIMSPKTMKAVEKLIITDYTDMSQISFIELTPNVHTLRMNNDLANYPFLIEKLPLYSHRWRDICEVFLKCSSIAVLTSVTFSFPINEQSLKLLCRCCPLLSKLKFDASHITSLKSLSSLSKLKVI